MAAHLLRSALTVSGLTLLSRILGFARDIVLAHAFGAGSAMDAFLVAFKIPNFLRRLFGEGAFSHAFVPVLSEYKTQRDQQAVRELVANTAGTLGSVLLGVSAASMIAAPLVILLFAPGFYHHPEKFALAVDMLRLTFPYLFFISLTAFAGALLNTYGHFAVPAFTPVLLNVCLIGAALWLAPQLDQPIVALAWAVPVAGAIQLAFQLPFLARLKLMPMPRFHARHEGVQRILRLMLPALFGVSVTQISLLVDTLMASFLTTGSVAWLYYADRLLEFPIGVFGMALSTVLLPVLSRCIAEDNLVAYSRTLNWGLRWVFVIGAPCAMGLLVLAMPMMVTLFYRGAFDTQDVVMSSYALMAYTAGLLGFVLIKVLASGFYARQNTGLPVKIGVVAMLTNIFLNLALIGPLHHAGLALATAGSALLNAGLLYWFLRREQAFIPQAGWRLFLLRVVAATLGMGAMLWWLQPQLSVWLNASLATRSVLLAGLMVLGGLCYLVLLAGLGMRLGHLKSVA